MLYGMSVEDQSLVITIKVQLLWRTELVNAMSEHKWNSLR